MLLLLLRLLCLSVLAVGFTQASLRGEDDGRMAMMMSSSRSEATNRILKSKEDDDDEFRPTTSASPSIAPSLVPSVAPSLVPSVAPSLVPSVTPSLMPSSITPSPTTVNGINPQPVLSPYPLFNPPSPTPSFSSPFGPTYPDLVYVPLLDFIVTVEDTQDLTENLEIYLYWRLKGAFDSLLAIELAITTAERDNNRRNLRETISYSGKVTFRHGLIPLKQNIYESQTAALLNLDQLRDFVATVESVSVASINSVTNTPPPAPPGETKNNSAGATAAIIVSLLVLLVVCGFFAVRHYKNVKKQSRFHMLDNDRNNNNDEPKEQSTMESPYGYCESESDVASSYYPDDFSIMSGSDLLSQSRNGTLPPIPASPHVDDSQFDFGGSQEIKAAAQRSKEKELRWSKRLEDAETAFQHHREEEDSVKSKMVSDTTQVANTTMELSDDDEPEKLIRTCFAPPGRLGLVVDTTVDGPIVHQVIADCPLEGIVWPGDVIIAIDDTETRALSPKDLTALMTKNGDRRRKLTIMSEG